MGDFRLRQPALRYGRPRTGQSLGVGSLRLDPRLEVEIRALRGAPPSPRLRDLVLRPDWRQLQHSWLNALIATPPPPTTAPLVPPGRGPVTPREGEVSDVLRALWGIPAVQQAANRVLDDAGRRAQREWDRLAIGDKVLLVTHGAAIAGGALAGALSQPSSRELVLGLVLGRDIPVPGVDGLQFQIRERGGQASFSNIAGSGVSVRAGGQSTDLGCFQGEVQVTLDFAHWFPALR